MQSAMQKAFFDRVSAEGFARKLGLKLIELEAGFAAVEMKTGPEDGNIFNLVHGGAIFSLMDEAFQASCNSHGTMAVALDVNVVYHRPARTGCTLRAEAREIHRSKKTATYEIRVTDEKGRRIASSQALAYRKGDRLPFLDAPDALVSGG